jgi:ATP-binding cassette subfamily F protein uup
MARPPLLQLTDIALRIGGNPLFERVSLVVQPGDRIALAGRNGSGKSTLLKVMAGLVEPDQGTKVVPAGVSVGYLEQEPDFSGHATLGDWAAAGLPPGEGYRVEMAAEGLGFRAEAELERASGGERRRAALARCLAAGPDLLLLDEPTNHLDIAAIRWLEARLSEAKGAFVLISHDRAFLRALTQSVLWLDRGAARRLEQGFEAFEDWREEVWAAEDEARHKLERKIKAEGRWAVEGISARRKRNQGRLRTLAAMRAERAAMIRRQGTAAMALEAGAQSGRLVIEAKGVAKAFCSKPIVKGFDFRVMRRDRVAFVGPNGVGKTTLLKLLLGEIEPDEGSVSLGTGLEVAVFDQARSALDPEATLWETLTGDPAMRVAGRADQVMVRGAPRHVVGYLKEFLFGESQARAPVGSLSGGERARLLLARLMARESNLLVLDEPTNDLDVETLDLLQELLADYPGTVLLVSHDRDFLDRVATVTVAMEGDGRATVYAGGWSDYVAQRGGEPEVPRAERPGARSQPARTRAAPRRTGLSFTEKHRLDELPGVIDRLGAEIGKLTDFLAEPELYAREPVKFAKASEALAERQAALAAAEEEWLALAEMAEE